MTRYQPHPSDRLRAEDVTLGYGEKNIIDGVSVTIPAQSFTAIIGPNGCGKSTLLRGLARLLPPTSGKVLLDDRIIQRYPAKALARMLGLLPQSSIAPEGIRVKDLVARGRFPHQGISRRWSQADADAVHAALAATSVAHLEDRLVDELSGGQRQRVWIAMVLAQQTDILLLDEPTTYLDLAHQVDLLELLTDLHLEGRTLVTVLHDLNQAARYASHLIAMRDGEIVAEGPPVDVISEDLVREVFGLRCMIVPDPAVGTPQIVPLGRDRSVVGGTGTLARVQSEVVTKTR